MTEQPNTLRAFIPNSYSVEAINGSLAIWGHSEHCVSPLAYLRRPKWIKDDASWEKIVKSVRFSLDTQTIIE
jgi:hypothetical protein